MMTCNEARRLRARFVALELAPAQEARVRRHVAACAACRAAYVEQEPALALAWALGRAGEQEDETFVRMVMGGIRQRLLERRLQSRRRFWLAAAASLALVLGGSVVLRVVHPGRSQGVAQFSASPAARATADEAFVEVEGDGVRVYQLTADPQAPVQAAFIVDPNLEL